MPDFQPIARRFALTPRMPLAVCDSAVVDLQSKWYCGQPLGCLKCHRRVCNEHFGGVQVPPPQVRHALYGPCGGDAHFNTVPMGPAADQTRPYTTEQERAQGTPPIPRRGWGGAPPSNSAQAEVVFAPEGFEPEGLGGGARHPSPLRRAGPHDGANLRRFRACPARPTLSVSPRYLWPPAGRRHFTAPSPLSLLMTSGWARLTGLPSKEAIGPRVSAGQYTVIIIKYAIMMITVYNK